MRRGLSTFHVMEVLRKRTKMCWVVMGNGIDLDMGSNVDGGF